jgi:hypothetical protein
MSEAIEYKLEEPIRFGSELIETFHLKPLKAKHMKELPVNKDNMTIGHFLVVVGNMTSQPTAVIDELGAADQGKLFALVGSQMELLSKKT